MITGEPIPVLKKKGSKVVGGTLNTNSIFSFRAEKIGKDTVLAQIIALVEHAQSTKPPVQRIADVAVTYFIPTVLAIAFTAFAVWYLFARQLAALCPHGLDLCPCCRLPVCTRACHSYCGHRGGRTRCGTRYPGEERRGARDLEQPDHRNA